MEEGRLTIDDAGHEVYYCKYGDASNTLLGLHGGPGAGHGMLTTLERVVGDDLQLVLFDQLGCGKSDAPDDPSLYTVERFVDEVDAVRTGLDLGRVHLFGRSWGGMLALQYTLDHPDGVESLIVSNSAPSIALVCAEMTRLTWQLPPEQQRALMRHQAAGTLDTDEFKDLMTEMFSRHLRRSFPWNPERSRAEFLEVFQDNIEEMDQNICHKTMWGNAEFTCRGNLIDWDVVDRLGGITVPTLLLCGYYDEVGVAANRIMADRIPDNEFVIFGNSSHLNYLEKESNLYHAAISNFLRRNFYAARVAAA